MQGFEANFLEGGVNFSEVALVWDPKFPNAVILNLVALVSRDLVCDSDTDTNRAMRTARETSKTQTLQNEGPLFLFTHFSHFSELQTHPNFAQPGLSRSNGQSSPAREGTNFACFVPTWLVLPRWGATNLGVFDLCHFVLLKRGCSKSGCVLELADLW